MKLSYQKKGNYTYAKVPGESYCKNGHIKNETLFTLGVSLIIKKCIIPSG